MAYPVRTRDQHFFDPGPKRILSLDGGGLRGAFTMGVLYEMEAALRSRHGDDPDFRLSHYFDLMAGTSTGAIIATMLALGNRVEDVFRNHYLKMGATIFKKAFFWGFLKGTVRPMYDRRKLSKYLKRAVGAESLLGDDESVGASDDRNGLRTGLLIITKRSDTNSVWPIGNNPRGKYFGEEGGSFPNRDYPLWRLLRASSAAPTYFHPERIRIAPGFTGEFVDGGVSPFNDPSIQALMYVTLGGYRVGWETGADRLLMISVGTGSFDGPPEVPRLPFILRWVRGLGSVLESITSLMYDNQVLARAMLQWFSTSPTATKIDGEVGDLSGDLLGGSALTSYVRYDADLRPVKLEPVLDQLSRRPTPEQVATLGKMDSAPNVELLWEIGRIVGRQQIQGDHFPPRFDLDAGR